MFELRMPFDEIAPYAVHIIAPLANALLPVPMALRAV